MSASNIEKKKALTGYNVFTKEKMAELKAQNVPSSERMAKVGAMWKASSETVKNEYKVKAGGSPKSSVGNKESTGKKLTGYQLYVRETMAVVKLDAKIVPTKRLGAIGKLWKALSKEKQGEYSVKAKAL